MDQKGKLTLYILELTKQIKFSKQIGLLVLVVRSFCRHWISSRIRRRASWRFFIFRRARWRLIGRIAVRRYRHSGCVGFCSVYIIRLTIYKKRKQLFNLKERIHSVESFANEKPSHFEIPSKSKLNPRNLYKKGKEPVIGGGSKPTIAKRDYHFAWFTTNTKTVRTSCSLNQF